MFPWWIYWVAFMEPPMEMFFDNKQKKLERLQAEHQAIFCYLKWLSNGDPLSETVQAEIALHDFLVRRLWRLLGGQVLTPASYKQYVVIYEKYGGDDEQPDPDFSGFMRLAMTHFADTQL